MKKLFDLHSGKTLICHLFSPRDPAEAIREAQGAAAAGADAIAVELFQFKETYRSEKFFREIIDCVDLPFMFIDYRNDIFGWDDERRINMLMQASAAGAGMIDVVGDLFCPSPDEIARDEKVVARQIETIRLIHDAGSQVIVSSHPQRRMSYDAVFAQLAAFAARGADVVKIVAAADTGEAYAESLTTTVKLAQNLATPFVYLCSGKFSRIQRMAAFPLGGAITFAVWRYHDFAPYNQPTVEDFVRLRELYTKNLPETRKGMEK